MTLIKNYKIYIEDDEVRSRFILERIIKIIKNMECVWSHIKKLQGR